MPHLFNDLKSSLVVSLVALPLCLGIALASGAPLASGLLAGIIGGVITGFISNSNISVSGPAAGLTVIVLAQIESFGLSQFFQIVTLAGLFQVFFSFIKGGRIGNIFPNSVIHGMLAAIGLTLIIKQLPLALGTDFTIFKISTPHLLISAISLITITAWDKFNFRYNYLSFIPSALLAVGISIFLNLGLNLFSQEDLVSIPENLFSNIEVTLPSLSAVSFPMILGALTIAIVASLESLLCIDAADKIDPEKRTTNKNRELIAQGIGNTLCGLIGALPVTAVIVRTTANIGAGAKTKWSAIIHGLWLLLFISLGTSILNKVPLATLAVILLIVGFRLNRPSLYIAIYKKGLDQFFVFSVTIVAILTTDLLYGIFIGLVVSLLLEVRLLKNKVLFKKDGLINQLTFVGRTSYLSRLKVYDVFTHLKDEEKLLIQTCEDMHPDVEELVLDLKDRFPEKIELSGNRTVKTDS